MCTLQNKLIGKFVKVNFVKVIPYTKTWNQVFPSNSFFNKLPYFNRPATATAMACLSA